MYSIEGNISFKRRPEDYIGKFGLIHEDIQHTYGLGTKKDKTDKIRVIATHRWLANKLANRYKKKELLPQDAEVEQITTIEQAKRFSTIEKKEVDIIKLIKPDTKKTLEKVDLPEGADLLEGFARLWREFRFPSPFIYILSVGKLLDEVEYSSDNGWQQKWDKVGGRKIEYGIITPNLWLKRIHTKTHGERKRTRYY